MSLLALSEAHDLVPFSKLESKGWDTTVIPAEGTASPVRRWILLRVRSRPSRWSSHWPIYYASRQRELNPDVLGDAFDAFNPNCGSRALDYLDATAADVCMFQEMKCRMSDLDQQARTAAGQGWRLAGGPAKVTDKNGVSSGVAVAVRGHLGMAQPVKPLALESDVRRFCVRWLGAVDQRKHRHDDIHPPPHQGGRSFRRRLLTPGNHGASLTGLPTPPARAAPAPRGPTAAAARSGRPGSWCE